MIAFKPNFKDVGIVKTPSPLKSVWRLVSCPICSEIYKVAINSIEIEKTCSNGHTYILEGNAIGLIEFKDKLNDNTSII